MQQAGFIDLGVINRNVGDQTTRLVATWTWLNTAVSIGCKRFSVNFGAAALRPTQAAENH